ncbi:MAG: hypothetical protein ACYTXC_26660 [Nostoc sp.]
MQFTKFYYGNDSENTKLTLLNVSRSLFILMYKWSLTRPTVWNIKANFKVVRQDVRNIRDWGKNTVSWLTIVVNPSGVVRNKNQTACGRRAAACGRCARPSRDLVLDF